MMLIEQLLLNGAKLILIEDNTIAYGFPQARKAFEDANVELTTLTNYNTLVEVAHETGYIKEADIEILKDWRISPSTWGK